MRALTLISIVILLSCSGCFRYSEALTVDQDGAGRAITVMLFPASNNGNAEVFAALEKKLNWQEGAGAPPDGIRIETTEIQQEGRRGFKTTVEFDDIRKLQSWGQNSPFNNMATLRTGSTLEYSRRFAPLGQEILEVPGEEWQITFSFTGPGRLVWHNGTRADGNTVIWQLGLRDLFGGTGRSLGAKFVYGTPVWIYVLSIILIIFAAVAVYLSRRRQV